MGGCLKFFFYLCILVFLIEYWYIFVPLIIVFVFLKQKFFKDNERKIDGGEVICDDEVYSQEYLEDIKELVTDFETESGDEIEAESGDEVETELWEKYNYQIEEKIKKEKSNMYDKERGIYPAGQYLVGRDLPLGAYLLTAREGKMGYIRLYQTYSKYKKQEDEISEESFDMDYHLCLMEENSYLVVDDADLQKL